MKITPGAAALVKCARVTAVVVGLITAALLFRAFRGVSARPLARVNADPLTLFATGSCNQHFLPSQPIFRAAAALRSPTGAAPAFWLWGGDATDADKPPHMWEPNPLPEMRKCFDALKAHTDYRALAQAMPIAGVWDDHDFGLNNGDGSFPDKSGSRELYFDFIDEPYDSPRRRHNGTYEVYVFGAAPRKAKVLLLDVRYFRESPGTGAGHDLLGEEQWQWLESELRGSDAALHVIASGIQVVPRNPTEEKWAQHPASRKRLFELLRDTKARGVLLLTGDVHRAELWRTPCTDLPYDAVELTTSGMAHTCDTTIPMGQCENLLNTWFYDPHRKAYYHKYNFATVRVDWDAPEPAVVLSAHDEAGTTRFTERIRLAELQPPAVPRGDWRQLPECASDVAWEHDAHPTYTFGIEILLLTVLALQIALAVWVLRCVCKYVGLCRCCTDTPCVCCCCAPCCAARHLCAKAVARAAATSATAGADGNGVAAQPAPSNGTVRRRPVRAE